MSVWKHPTHGVFYLREPVPEDVRQRVGKATYKRSLGTKDRAEARRRYPDALAVFTAWVEGVRQGPRTLTSAEVEGLVGKWYTACLDAFSRDPRPLAGLPEFIQWSAGINARGHVLASLMVRPTPDDLRRGFIGPEVDALVAAEGLLVDEASHARLCERLTVRLGDLLRRLNVRMLGDYSPDPVVQQFPAWTPAVPAGAAQQDPDRLTFAGMLSRWDKRAQRSPKTVREYRNAVQDFAAFVGHDDPARVETHDVERWRDALKARGLRTATVQKKMLAALSAVYAASQGTGRGRLSANPVDGAWYQGRVFSDSTKRRPYTTAELSAILKAARRESRPELRWFPWLMAYTGLRHREAAQLVKEDIRTRDGIHYVDVNTDHAHKRVKGKPGHESASVRDVPLHRDVIAEGFLAYVDSLPAGALLFPRIAPRADGGDNQGRPVQTMREWLRVVSGAKGKEHAPVHSFRHSFEDLLREATQDSELRLDIQGREDGKSARGYGDGHALQRKHEAVERIPSLLDVRVVAALLDRGG
ncbi:DUF6538 domain-containing protein [Solimonas variicoloris]|uniref:DUF6538 domain-containing protein n=1 Tax=Solimonas variicoloris TaxID=254408 RepID=UPI00146E5503|nr:DUF6538 domain-containing protein [Solimonas variicoloris]